LLGRQQPLTDHVIQSITPKHGQCLQTPNLHGEAQRELVRTQSHQRRGSMRKMARGNAQDTDERKKDIP
jgi:hypothetical protein